MRFSVAPAALTLACAVSLSGASGAAGARARQDLLLAGVDVSSYQHGTSLDWAKVQAAGQDFAFVKATEGTGYTNSYFAPDWAGLRQLGMARGAYHFARPNLIPGSAAAQARYFVQVVGLTHEPGALAPLFDMEDAGGLTPAQLVTWSHTWLDTVQALTGRKPIIYTYAYFWQTAMGDSQEFTAYPLFLADYHDLTGTTTPRPGMPGGWATWTFWQYSDAGNVPGISGPVDMDRYNGSSVFAATWGQAAPAPGGTPILPLSSYKGQLLQAGSAGPAVTALQKFLGTTQDGAFGPMTTASLRAYQSAHAVPTTGVTDARTWAVLVPAPAPAPAPQPVPVINPLARYKGQLLQVGSRGPAVAALQTVLRITSDGDFGPFTRAALIGWQQAHRLPATGVTDARTWAVLVPVPAQAPAPQPVPVINPLARYKGQLLQVGSRGPAVAALQTVVRITSDGDFGPFTRAALIGWQQAHRLPATGVTDARTWAVLVPVPAPVPASPLVQYRTTILRVGSSGAAVIALQKALRIGADGQFGPLTQAAVTSYQRARNLPVTGVVTEVMWTALIAGR